jgi:hypothetical protein
MRWGIVSTRHEPLDVANAVDDVHRRDLLGEALVVAVAAAEVQLPDRPTRCPRARSS